MGCPKSRAVTAENLYGVNHEIQASDNLLCDRHGPGARCGVCGGLGYGPFQSGELRQGLGHHDQDKTQLAAEHLGSAKHISVDTDKNGVVWLTGTANTQAEVDKAVTIARNTEGVRSVKSELTIVEGPLDTDSPVRRGRWKSRGTKVSRLFLSCR